MKLKRTRSRTVGARDYYRWTIQLPPSDIEKLGWKEGDQLTSATRKGVLRVSRLREKGRK